MSARVKGVLKPLDPADPRSPDHPSHAAKWLEMAAALGRMMADLEFDRAHKGDQNDKDGGTVRKVLK